MFSFESLNTGGGSIGKGDARSGVDAGYTSNNFSKKFGNMGGVNFDISLWLVVVLFVLLFVFAVLWLKKKK